MAPRRSRGDYGAAVRLEPQGAFYGLRPVPRAAGGAAGRDPDVRAPVRVADRGGRGDRLVRAAPRGRGRRRGARDHARRPGRGVQALRDGPRVPAAPHAAVARDRPGHPVPGRRHRRARRGRRGGGGRGRRRRRGAAASPAAASLGIGEPAGGRVDEPPAASSSRRSPSAGWELLDDEARERLDAGARPRASSSTSPGPHGWEHSATNLGRVERLDGAPVRRRRARGSAACSPLVELRAPFIVSRARAARRRPRRGRRRPRRRSTSAARRIARRRERAPSSTGSRRPGSPASSRRRRTTPIAARRRLPSSYPRAGRAGRSRRCCARASTGPYGLALGARRVHAASSRPASTAATRCFDHLREILGGPIVWAPGRRRRASCSACAAATSCSSRGEDLSIGYERHDADASHLYLEESFSFRVATPEAAVALP